MNAFRWKRDPSGKIVEKEGRQVAQFVAVQRRDNNEWALPGVSETTFDCESVCEKQALD